MKSLGFQQRFFSGLCGLQLPVPKNLYPAPFENASRLTYYSSLFNSIEINSSFYRIPQAATVTKWVASVSENFRFTFKLWKGITHNAGLDFSKDDVNAFLTAIKGAAEKMGCLLIQFPPSLNSAYSVQLVNLLNCIKESNTEDWKIAVEFRNNSWYHEHIYDLLKGFNVAIVIHDIPKSRTPLLNQTSDFIYVRFHGPTGNYRDSYTEDFINDYAAYINEWVEEGRTVYAYFNNTMGDAFNNVTTLNSSFQDKIGMA